MCPVILSQTAAKIPLDKATRIEPFSQFLSRNGLNLVRERTCTLQINVGLLCNQACRHCHLEAGPGRREVMNVETVCHVVDYARRGRFEVADITGGAPELNPNLVRLIRKLSHAVPRVMVRSNLTALSDGRRDFLMEFCKEHRVAIVASFPSLDLSQAESQRGQGTFKESIAVLNKLNSLGYGQEGSGLELDLVSNPTGAFLPPTQGQAEMRFRKEIDRRWGIVFNHLYTFANVPLGRFRSWLLRSDNLGEYMERLASQFNPKALEGVMCRTLVSVSWEGYLYDCDFNLSQDLSIDGRKIHVSQMAGPPEPGTPIAVSDHCYACTAGTGFT
ncbi:MAG: radical SAM/Cys-rich domain protein [Proteobacteria bacterium]|nr:radical SAM/Cys-rich domain protein [Pseudomonadota bacterium]